MIVFETEIIDVIQRVPGVKSFRFKTKDNAVFKPGQFFFVTIKIDGKEQVKHFSFSNSPTETGYLEFTKRITNSEFSNALNSIKKGSWAKIQMPYGNFTLDTAGSVQKIAFLSAGIGITAIRSMCRYIIDKNLDFDVKLLYGNSFKKDIIFKEDFDSFSSVLKIVYTLTEGSEELGNSGYRFGFINGEMIKKEIPDFEDRIFYICGSPAMVKKLSEILKNELNINENQIILENFFGY
jgi:ferredoxin-NADP reductase